MNKHPTDSVVVLHEWGHKACSPTCRKLSWQADARTGLHEAHEDLAVADLRGEDGK